MAIGKNDEGLYIALISVHGLIRATELELGRDADTGGQIKYVIELARALALQEEVAQVDLFTRLVCDPQLDGDYAEPIEVLGERARIVRIEAGPSTQYIHKEDLWDHLDAFADNMLAFMREGARLPDLIHSHYADGGYVGSRLTHLLGVPLIHTGHSLGRIKRRRLLATGLSAEQIETTYNMTRRIEAEETTLASAELVITSTHQEIEEQYGYYDHYLPDQMQVIPPGTDLQRCHPPVGDEWQSSIGEELRRFLNTTDKPIILALSRPDSRKNIRALVEAYGESPKLQRLANLVLVAGNRDDISEMESGAREVLNDLLLLIDSYDLYGKVAYPKHHTADEAPVFYRLAALSGGVFVNPALTEPFGLTLIEAGASGLPVIATEDGGPIEIIANCRNGVLIDPLDREDIAQAILKVLRDDVAWREYSQRGVAGVKKYYSWPAHARRYLEAVGPIIKRTRVLPRTPMRRRSKLYSDRAIFTDVDQSLLGAPKALPQLFSLLHENKTCATFGIVTGRRLDSALQLLRKHQVPEPDVFITSGGTEIYYAPKLTPDTAWARHIDHHWMPQVVTRLLADLPGLKLQPKSERSRFKISYFIDPNKAPSLEQINSLLHQEDQEVNVIQSFGQYLDILPIRASKGLALRYVADRWGIALEQTLVAGGSGADEDMMRGNTLAVVVANRHHEELSGLTDQERIYFASRAHALGILEAIEHYHFFDNCAPTSD